VVELLCSAQSRADRAKSSSAGMVELLCSADMVGCSAPLIWSAALLRSEKRAERRADRAKSREQSAQSRAHRAERTEQRA
jgi:hypothetical protein